MKKLLLLSCIGLAMGTAAFGEDQSEMVEMQQLDSATGSSRLSYKFDLWHETDRVRNSDNQGDVTDIGTSFKITDNETNLFFMYELLTTSLTRDASERERHNFRFGQNDMFTLGGFTVTPYYQFRYEDHSKGSRDERMQHRLGYSGANDHGWSFWGYSSYDSFDGSTGNVDESGYYGEHELLYSFDLGQGVMTTSVFNEYQTLTYSSFNNTQARAEYMHPMAEGFVMGPFTELDLHRRTTGRSNDATGQRRVGDKNTDNVYVAGLRGYVTMSEQWSAWNEVSWNFVESGDDVLYIETGLTYKF